jgi:hypothetical protein
MRVSKNAEKRTNLIWTRKSTNPYLVCVLSKKVELPN